jgi:hypothetical protein
VGCPSVSFTALNRSRSSIISAHVPPNATPAPILAQRLGDHHAVGQIGQRIIARQIGDPFGILALFGHIRGDAVEPFEIAAIGHARRSRHFPPTRPSHHMHPYSQTGKIFPVPQPRHQFTHRG